MDFHSIVLFVLCVCLSLSCACCQWAPNVPIRGWSSWNTFYSSINETLIRDTADAIVNTGLAKANYLYVLIDDGWTDCTEPDPNSDRCLQPGPRDSNNRIIPSPSKFPSGMLALTNYIHSLGLLAGIYTAVSATTCGGYTSSLGYEEIDAYTFVCDWGFDFVKHDTCNIDCSMHNGCIQNSTAKMSAAIWNASLSCSRHAMYYIDGGNPTGPMKVYNPWYHGVYGQEELRKVALYPSELIWNWAFQQEHTHMIKSWFDRMDTWPSLLSNIQQLSHLPYYQQCGKYHTADMMTTGMGGMPLSMYRVEVFMYSVLASPLILGCDVRNLAIEYLELLTSPEVLNIQQDPQCVQGSQASAFDSGEVWIKPLSDGSFAVGLMNKGSRPLNITVQIDRSVMWSDFYPADYFTEMYVRDVYRRVDLGVFSGTFTQEVPAFDAMIFQFTQTSKNNAEEIPATSTE